MLGGLAVVTARWGQLTQRHFQAGLISELCVLWTRVTCTAARHAERSQTNSLLKTRNDTNPRKNTMVLHWFWNRDQVKTQTSGSSLTPLTTSNTAPAAENSNHSDLCSPAVVPEGTGNCSTLTALARGEDHLGWTMQMHPGERKVRRCCAKLHKHKNISHFRINQKETRTTHN